LELAVEIEFGPSSIFVGGDKFLAVADLQPGLLKIGAL
jgi:hypothetical protein